MESLQLTVSWHSVRRFWHSDLLPEHLLHWGPWCRPVSCTTLRASSPKWTVAAECFFFSPSFPLSFLSISAFSPLLSLSFLFPFPPLPLPPLLPSPPLSFPPLLSSLLLSSLSLPFSPSSPPLSYHSQVTDTGLSPEDRRHLQRKSVYKLSCDWSVQQCQVYQATCETNKFSSSMLLILTLACSRALIQFWSRSSRWVMWWSCDDHVMVMWWSCDVFTWSYT